MDGLKFIAGQVPMFIASVIFVLAAGLKAGKEKGSMLVLFGAAGIMLMIIATPIIYSLIMPKIVASSDGGDIASVYAVLGLLLNVLWAVALGLVAAGTFLRKPPTE